MRCATNRCQQGRFRCPTPAQCHGPRLRDPMPIPTDFGVTGPHSRRSYRLRLAVWAIAALTALGLFLFSVAFTLGALLGRNL